MHTFGRTMSRILILALLLLSDNVQGFVTSRRWTTWQELTILHAKKGFGAKETPAPKKKPAQPSTTTAAAVPSPPPPEKIDPFPERDDPDMSMGKAALERMRRERAEKRNQELLRVKEVQEVDALLRESPEAAVIPEKVAQRMGKRMLPFVGVPLFGAMGSFVGFWYMATYRDMEFQPALVATSTIVLLVVGLVGITYSIMSASWDPDREGSFLGLDEFSKNVENIKTGLSRSRENAILRDKMDEFSATEIAALDRKVASKEKRQQSFGEKLGEEFE